MHKRQADCILLWRRSDILYQRWARCRNQQTMPIYVPLWNYLRGTVLLWLHIIYNVAMFLCKCMCVWMYVHTCVYCVYIPSCICRQRNFRKWILISLQTKLRNKMWAAVIGTVIAWAAKLSANRCQPLKMLLPSCLRTLCRASPS